ncbi:NACHT, LRR and PYD domains-containing protein 3-like [Callorhinchus milii]|uniref:NACHT, LRR and PYD domains-containing protein 3-like n=1 Tax=Callorhinchus milii TaxID=7868 RepID=UPI001C3FCD84|nr:NACHT, LRR and PYD domains-containing protein 3-like [Callorhinchus milii]
MGGSSSKAAPVQSSRGQSSQASACLNAASVERDRNRSTEDATRYVNRQKDDDKIAIRQILKSYSDSELHMVTVFYRQRLEVMDDLVEDLTLMLEKLLRGRQFAHIRNLANRKQRQEASRYLLDLVTGARSRVQRGMWDALLKIEENTPQLKAILREIQENGNRLPTEVFRSWCEENVPEELRDVQKQHKETLRAQNEKLSVNTLGGREKTKTFLLSDRYTELIVTSFPRERRLVEHELVARGREHEEWQEKNVRKELKKIQPDELFGTTFGTTILSGIAGIGKTTMVQNILYGWATGKIYPQLHFVFHFKFRDLNVIKGESSLKTMVLESYPYLQDVLDKIWEKPEHLLFVFDGLDEFKGRIKFTDSERNTVPRVSCPGPEGLCTVADIVRSLVQQEVLKGCSVLITSRPTALESLDHIHTNLWAEILGFFAEGREDYIRRFFPDEKIAAEVLRYVKENDILYTMCFNPSYCWILCCTLEPIFKHPEHKQPPPKPSHSCTPVTFTTS